MNDLIIAFILGVLEGLSEFLPISSTGHLIIAGHLLDFSGEKETSFMIMIQLGAILAIVVIYWQRFLKLVRIPKWDEKQFNLFHIFFGIIPFLLMGFLFNDFIKDVLFSPKTVAVGLVIGALLMIYAQKKEPKEDSVNSLDELTYKQAFVVGLFQCLALWPGFSRSGSTISGGLLSKLNYKTAADFSFMAAVPIMMAATGYDLLKNYHLLSSSDIPVFLVGFFTAFVVALIAVKTFLHLLSRLKLIPFAIYRILLAIIVLVFVA